MRGGTLLFLGHWVKGQGQLWHSVYKTLSRLVDTIQTTVLAESLSNFTCKLWMIRRGTPLILGHGVKGKVNFGTLCIKPCGQDKDYIFFPITFKLHMYVVDDERKNPIDFGSRDQRSRSTLPPPLARGCHALRCLVIHVLFSNFQFLWALKVSPGLGSLSMPTQIES